MSKVGDGARKARKRARAQGRPPPQPVIFEGDFGNIREAREAVESEYKVTVVVGRIKTLDKGVLTCAIYKKGRQLAYGSSRESHFEALKVAVTRYEADRTPF